MSRPRLRILKSCQHCRRHHNKCDGKRPQCDPCTRRGYVCLWAAKTDPRLYEAKNRSTQSDNPPYTDLTHSIESSTVIGQSSYPDKALDIYAAQPTDEVPFDFETLSSGIANGQRLPASSTEFGNRFDEHVIVSGVIQGWTLVTSSLRLDSQWSHIMHLDSELARLGYASVLRLAILWFTRMKMKVVASFQCGISTKTPLPLWATEKPSIRRVAALNPGRFCNTKWSNEYMRQGICFGWPFDEHSAYINVPDSKMIQLSPEFILRVTNLRSWALSKQFLDEPTELRGMAPQLEPSATTRLVSAQCHLKDLYWQMLRQKWAKAKTHKKTQKDSSPCFVARGKLRDDLRRVVK